MTNPTKIAIACQGGGSHTAFTAGVLQKFFDLDVHKKWRIVGLSGTSGGAICATIAWHGLLKAAKGDDSVLKTGLMDFWSDNSAKTAWERYLNNYIIEKVRLEDSGYIPGFAANPYADEGSMNKLKTLTPRKEYLDFPALLAKHIPFQTLHNFVEPESPRLLLGAVDVLSGTFKAFDSKKGEISLEAVQASAAIPNIFKAVQIGNGAYWDGLFSENPPISGFVDEEDSDRPDELWVIQINPETRKDEPKTASDIQDRRNELAGNLSLYQEIKFIKQINSWIASGAFTPEFLEKNELRPMEVRFVRMSDELSDSLDYASKLDRSPAALNELIEDGKQAAEGFLDTLLVA